MLPIEDRAFEGKLPIEDRVSFMAAGFTSRIPRRTGSGHRATAQVNGLVTSRGRDFEPFGVL